LADKPSGDTSEILEYFDNNIKAIVKKFLSKPRDADTIWKIVEECCIQSVPSGLLDPNDYFVSILQPDNTPCPEEDITPREWKWHVKQDWLDFWGRSLNKCPGGPTIFVPPKGRFRADAEGDPPYLFRTYDSQSWGLNSADTIASVGHQTYGPANGKIDIFSMKEEQASGMLYKHLKMDGISTTDDNLVSWSSSLMSVIQRANYRFCKYKAKDIVICALNTSKFPEKQFIRDMRLLERIGGGGEYQGFRTFRLNSPSYNDAFDNGEYLSQGRLDLQDRSCTLSWRGLKEAGLWDLYPEFDIDIVEPDAPVRKQWKKYIELLHKKWSEEYTTTKNELKVAINIAKTCFAPFDETEIALLLLAFRNRKLNGRGKS
jgi:hypothetical protein